MAGNSTLQFAEEYARFKNELEGIEGSIGYLSQRGLASALLTIFAHLRADPDPASAVAAAIRAYRAMEREDRDQDAGRRVREQENRDDGAAREALARTVSCPHCHAVPRAPCQTSAGKAVPRSHEGRHVAADRLDGGT